MKGWKILGKLFMGVGLMFILPSPSSSSAADGTSLRVVYNALGGSMAPVWISQQLGLFAKHRLQHNLNYMAATTAVQAIATGTIIHFCKSSRSRVLSTRFTR